MMAIRLWDWVNWGDALFQVVELSTADSVIEHASTGERTRISTAELAAQATLSMADEASPLGEIGELARVSAAARKRAETIASAIEVGYASDISKLASDRLSLVIGRLASAGINVTGRQVYRYMRQYRLHGMTGLVDQRSTPAPRQQRTDPRLDALIEDELKAQVRASTGTRSRAIARIGWEADRQGIPLPSVRTMYRLIEELDHGRGSFGPATSRRSKAARPDRTYKHLVVSQPGEVVEIDSTPLDVLVVMPNGSTGRPELTYAIDVATSTICGTLLRQGRAKSVDVATLLLARMLMPLPRRPSWQHTVETARAILGTGQRRSETEWEQAAATMPVVVPQTLTVDRGKVFVSSTFTAALERLQISQIKANPRQGTDKPHVEGGFKRIRDGFVQFLEGYTGGRVSDRGAAPEAAVLWTLDELQALLDIWVLTHWQTEPQSGLRLPGMPKRTLSPNQMYRALSVAAPTVSVGISTDEYIALMPLEWRSIQPYGINFDSLTYDADDLHPLRGRKSGLRGAAAGRWEVRYDPYDMSRIWVRDHKAGRWITAHWTLGAKSAQPYSREILREARKAVGVESDRPLSGIDILAEVSRIQESRHGALERTSKSRSASRLPQTPLAAVPSGKESVGEEPGPESETHPLGRLRLLD